MKCKVCGKEPSEIQEYIDMARAEGDASPEAYVRRDEGTYNRETGEFYCTLCYIKIGMPLGTA